VFRQPTVASGTLSVEAKWKLLVTDPYRPLGPPDVLRGRPPPMHLSERTAASIVSVARKVTNYEGANGPAAFELTT